MNSFLKKMAFKLPPLQSYRHNFGGLTISILWKHQLYPHNNENLHSHNMLTFSKQTHLVIWSYLIHITALLPSF